MKKFIIKNKGKINFIILLLVTIIVLYLSLKNDFSKIMEEILKANPIWIIISFLLVISYWFFRSLALNNFIKQFNSKHRFLSSFQLMLRTQFFNGITPFATGGQPYQIYYLKEAGISISSSTSIILQNFIVYQIALVFLGILALIGNFFGHIFKDNILLGRLLALGFIINTVVIVVMFIIAFNEKISHKLISLGIKLLSFFHLIKDSENKREEWNKAIFNFHHSASILLQDKKKFALAIFYNFIALLGLYLIPLTLLYAIGDYTSYTSFQAIVASAYVMVIGSFVPIPGGSGGLEYGFIAFYGNFINGAVLTAIMLLWRFITYYFGIIVGAIALNVKRVK